MLISRMTPGEHLFDWEITHWVLTHSFLKGQNTLLPTSHKILVGNLISHLSMLLSISCAVVTLHSLGHPSKGWSEDRWLQES